MRAFFKILIVVVIVVVIAVLIGRYRNAHNIKQDSFSSKLSTKVDAIVSGKDTSDIKVIKRKVNTQLNKAKQVVEAKSDNLKKQMDSVQQRFKQTNLFKQLSEKDDTIQSRLKATKNKFLNEIRNKEDYDEIQHATIVTDVHLTNHHVFYVDTVRMMFLIDKGVDRQIVEFMIDRLSKTFFFSPIFEKNVSLAPIYSTLKMKDNELVGLTLELKLPSGKRQYIFNKYDLTNKIVGFSYMIQTNTLIIYN